MATMYSKILVATDGSEQNHQAVLEAIGLAKSEKAELHCLYIVDTIAFASLPMDVTWENVYNVLYQEGKEAIELVKKQAKKEGVKFFSSVLEGNPAVEIVKYAQENGADLIVVGTLGRGGLSRFLLGSTAEKVIRTAPCPVMVVRQPEE